MLGRDVRYALRILRKSPLFTTAATLTLAVAIGVNTAVFSVVDAVLLRPLPYPNPDQLALVSRIVRADGREDRNTSVDGRTWQAVRDQAASVESAVFSSWTTGVNLVAGGREGTAQGRYVQQQRVGAGFFRTLGVNPTMGREFSAEEDRAGGPAAAILSASLWRNLFGADPGIVGRMIVLCGAPVPVVGVMPDTFQSSELADLWTPLRASTTGEGGGENYQVLLRLRPGGSWPQTQEELSRLASMLGPPTDVRASVTFSYVPLQQGLSEGLQQPLLILWSAVGVVLLVACVNLAGLLMARGSQRYREIATRMALGSGRTAVIRQLLVESAVIAAIGGLAGLGFGAVALDGLTWLARDAYEIWQPVALDARSVAAAAALSITACLLFGLGPAVQATRGDVQSRLVHASARSVAGVASRWPRCAIVMAQMALGVVLLVAAGLLVRTFTHLRGLDPGFDPDNVVTAAVSVQDDRYRTREQVNRLFDQTLASVGSAPGIEGAAVALEVPYKRLLNLGFRHLDGAEAAAGGQMTNATYVTPGFFDVMRIPIRRGRAFSQGDRADTTPVVIVSDAFVRMYFKGENPLGRRIAVAGAEREIVGQAGDVQVRPGWGDNAPLSAMPLAYIPAGQASDSLLRLVHGWFAPTFVVRTRTTVADAAAALRRGVDTVDPLLPFASVRPISDVRSASLAPQRFLMALLAGLAAATVLLAGIGIHGLIATTVTERTREMGIRLALGATAGHAIRTIAIPALVLTAAGIVTGLVMSALAVKAFQSFVWGISTSDPLTFTLAPAILLIVAAAAALLPARRILRLDPAQTLRAD